MDVAVARTSLASGTQARARPAWRRGKGGVQANCSKMWKGCGQNRGAHQAIAFSCAQYELPIKEGYA
eukprot:9489689-Pyramimonas_sp.AAC.1